MTSRLRWRSLGSKRTTGSGSVGATFQLGAMLGVSRSGGILKTSLISLTSEERRARPHMSRPYHERSGQAPAPEFVDYENRTAVVNAESLVFGDRISVHD